MARGIQISTANSTRAPPAALATKGNQPAWPSAYWISQTQTPPAPIATAVATTWRLSAARLAFS